ncbi:MAG: hypothetical protein AB7S77_06565 [Desulfatirhabdiaceae bacterium]
MHFEILVEDLSGKKALDILVPKIVGKPHTFKVHPYKGIGRIPRKMKDTDDASKRILLENLPKLLKGYGKTFTGYPDSYSAAVILICDLDKRCLKAFRQELFEILNQCHPKPETRFCIAIEEGEAWFLGDVNAVRRAYPDAKNNVLNEYINDTICGTWEKLADAVYPGGSSALLSKGWQTIGAEKSKWAESISACMDVMNNASPSFCYFRDKLRELAGVME